MPILFPEELVFGIPEIDQQHKDLFAIYDEFSDVIDNGHSTKALSELFTRLEEFTSQHFSFEVRLIEKSNYPGAENHLLEHNQISEEIKQFKIVLTSENVSKEVLLSIKRFLIRYLVNHTKNSDMMLCNHLIGLQMESDIGSTGCGASVKFRKIGEILVDLNIISRTTLNKALDIQTESGQKIGTVLIEMGATRADDIIEAFAIQMGLLKISIENDDSPIVV